MPSLSKHASVPTTIVATTHKPNGQAVTVSGAGPWTLTDEEIALVKQIRVSVSGTLYPINA